jgi:O-acetyl-ADP-ribose deacetylase (regulator of RNase III)
LIEIARGDILNANTDAIVNAVNCVGVMGRGLALQFRQRYPENFKAYAVACARKEVRPGRMFVYPVGSLTEPRYIINFPTKEHWKGNSRIQFIAGGLEDLIREVEILNIHSIAVPPLGCGLGGLRWQEVRPLIEAAFGNIPDVRVLLYAPPGASAIKETFEHAAH